MSKKTKTKTIGAWAESIGANVRNSAHWTLMHTREGTFAVVLMRTLVLRNGTVIAVAELGVVARGSTRPHDALWTPDSDEVREANELLSRAESKNTADLPAVLLSGFNSALPWEVPEPPKPAVPWWKQVLAWLRFN